MAYEFSRPSLAQIPEHIAGDKKWNCFQLFCVWQRPFVTEVLEKASDEVSFSEVTKELKRCWKSQPADHVNVYKEIAKLLPMTADELKKVREENSKAPEEVQQENRCQGSHSSSGQGIRRVMGMTPVKVSQKESRRPLKEAKAERATEFVHKGHKTAAGDVDTKKEPLSLVERLKAERLAEREEERARKAAAAELAKEERERTRAVIQEAKDAADRKRRLEEEARRASMFRKQDEARKRREEALLAAARRREERLLAIERENQARVEAERARQSTEAARLKKTLKKEQHQRKQARKSLEESQESCQQLMAMLEAEREQRRAAEEQANAIRRKYEWDLQKLSSMFQQKCSISTAASRLTKNAAVKHVFRMVGHMQRQKKQRRQHQMPVFIVIDTNSLEKKVLKAWQRSHASCQYQQLVAAGHAPLVNGVIPMAVLREVDFHNKQGNRKVGSMQGILEEQFRRFNADQQCFLHPQGLDQTITQSSSEARPTNEDEHILNCCLFFRETYHSCRIWLATRDRNLRLKAQANSFKADHLRPLLKAANVPVHV
mmetsp:Transcript_8000/g.33674  ORF Transcript_8000/g.33674 Transcript_8000/m.33674 type:complete len:547 (+) Transcript_8000:116-1756(+)